VATQPSKKQPEDAVEVTFLGVMLNFQTGHKQIPPGRMLLLLETLRSWATKSTGSLKEIQSLCGTLCHAARIIEVDRLFLTRLWHKIYYLEENPKLRSLSLGREFNLDIQWWLAFLKDYNGRSLMKPSGFQLSHSEAVSTDASGPQAAGVDEGKKYFWMYNFLDEESYYAEKIIIIKEAWALPVMAMMPQAGPTWAGKVVKFRCDNTGVVHSVRSGYSRNRDVAHLLRVLHYIGAIYDFRIIIDYVKSEDNVADKPTRCPLNMMLQDKCGLYRHYHPVLWTPPLPTDDRWEEILRRQAQARLDSQVWQRA